VAWKRTLADGAAGSAAALAGVTVRYAAGVARTDRSWPVQVEPGLRDLGEVDEVSILPLVERLTVGGRGLIGEPGVSYLVPPAPPGCCSTPACPAARPARRWLTTPAFSAWTWATWMRW
jgi:hypothetical protein